jgi:biopolymer transport protein TolQ
LNDSLSTWVLIANASWVVKGIMIILLLASLLSWLMIFQRARVLSAARKTLLEFEDLFWSGIDLGRLYSQMNRQPENQRGVISIFCSGFKEFARLHQQTQAEPEAVMEGAQRAMRVAHARQEEQLSQHLSFLATVGSTSPYIGLLGTVWGIMHAFQGLGDVSQATLATVAPGISEALIATAMGLFAAIPAVIAYNRYATKVDSLLNSYETFADEFSSILHRKAHSQAQPVET